MSDPVSRAISRRPSRLRAPVSEPPVSEPPLSQPSDPPPPASSDPAPRGEPATCTGTDPDCAAPALLGRPAAGASQGRGKDEPHGTRYSWSRERQRGAIGGSYRWERNASASISYGFRGGAVTLFTVEGRRMGKARVEIDGQRVATIDGYASRFRPDVRHRFSRLGGGAHTLTITPLGKKRPAAKGRRVVVDALRWGGKLHRDPKPEAVSWATVDDPSASEGGYVVSDAPGAEATLSFSGTGLTLRAVRGPARGRAQIWLDGKRRAHGGPLRADPALHDDPGGVGPRARPPCRARDRPRNASPRQPRERRDDRPLGRGGGIPAREAPPDPLFDEAAAREARVTGGRHGSFPGWSARP